jgi:hypothetical protein
MGYCQNCKTRLTCGCQKRKAKDGTACCSNCVTTYNNKLSGNTKSSSGTLNPTNVSASATIKK